ncbi:MAG TPA: nuclear transport factor 2 family protein [Acetobacteraceae bacterium]
MRTTHLAIALAACLLAAPAARAAPADEARLLYAQFAEAQNAGDFARIAPLLWDSSRFLWVTNGVSVWGRDAAIARMAAYHTAEIWHIQVDEPSAAAVEIGPDAAYVHVRLELAIGSKAEGPDRFRFLVSALCARLPEGWRIAALFTTAANPE